MIDIQKLRVNYADRNVISDFSVTAQSGQLIILLGPNGCGKSTLLKAITGIIAPMSGQIKWQDRELSTLKLREKARQIAYLSQDRQTAPGLSVRSAVELGRVPYRGVLGRISPDGHKAIDQALEKTQTSMLADRPLSELSGGEQARVLLARLLAVDAPLLLADEPIVALDPFYQVSLMEVLKAEAMNGKLVICALHDLALAHQYADSLWLMKDGALVATGRPEVCLNEENLKQVFGIKPPQQGFASLRLS